MYRLTPNVYVSTTNEGCNTGFVVTSDGVVAHDAPMVKAQAKAWAAEIAEHGMLRYVISGEPHLDHVAGLCFMGGTLVGHESTRTVLADCMPDYKARMAKYHPESSTDKEFYFRMPDIELKGDITIHLGKHTFQIMILPGHTPWNICTFVPEEKVVFASDTVTGDVSVLDEAMLDVWIDNLKFIHSLDVEHIVAGHGEVKPKSYIPEFIAGLQIWLDVVGDAIKQGMTLEEAKKNLTMEKEFPDILERCPWKPDLVSANVERVYTYLVGRGRA